MDQIFNSIPENEKIQLTWILRAAREQTDDGEISDVTMDVCRSIDTKKLMKSLTEEQREVAYIMLNAGFEEYDDVAFIKSQNELKHYGIPGMKWRNRKASSSTNVSSRPSKPNGSKKSSGPKKPRRMTNRELQARINRLRLENEYSRLQKDVNKEKANKTIDKLDNLSNIGKNIANISGQALTIYKNINSLMDSVNARRSTPTT